MRPRVLPFNSFRIPKHHVLNENTKLGLTAADNRRHPSRRNALDWMKKSWDSLKSSCILNAVDKCYMNPDPGPEIEGHREENFEQGIEEDENDLEEADIEES